MKAFNFSGVSPVRLSLNSFLLVKWGWDPPLNTTFEVIIPVRVRKVLNPNGFRDGQPHHQV